MIWTRDGRTPASCSNPEREFPCPGMRKRSTPARSTPMSSNAIPPPRNYWQGKLIRLRAIEPEDGDTFHDWNLDSETARLLDFVWPPGSLAASRAWAQKMALQEVQDDRISCVIENRDRVLVGLINAHTVD